MTMIGCPGWASRRQGRWASTGLMAASVSMRRGRANSGVRLIQHAGTFAAAGKTFPAVEHLAGFDEYPAEAILQTLGKHLCECDPAIAALARSSESTRGPAIRYRDFHRLLEAVIARWIEGSFDRGLGLPLSWKDWSGGVRDSLHRVLHEAGKGSAVAIFTSGGVVAVTVQTVLEAPDIKAAELNWRVHNASVTQYTFSGNSRVSLDRFNDVSHLAPEQLTYR